LKKAKPKRKRSGDKTERHPLRLDQIVNRLIDEISSLQLSYKEISGVLNGIARSRLNASSDLLKRFVTSLPSDKKIKSLSIPIERVTELIDSLRGAKIGAQALLFSQRGQFLVLISQWDTFIASILRWIYEVQPEIINNSPRSLTFAELKEFRGIEDAPSRIIEEEVHSVLRNSHGDHFEYIEKKLGLKLRENVAIWRTFVEITQRRHLIAHSGGAVSHQYIKTCSEAGVPDVANIKIGQILKVDQEYFNSACECLLELGIKLGQVLWRKLLPTEIGKAEDHLIKVSLDLIIAEQYSAAINVLEFSLRQPMKFTESRSRLVCTVNLAQAHKWRGDEEECRKILKGEDWSSSSDDFLLVVAVLEERHDDAVRLMRKIGSKGDVKKVDYDTWPAFRIFRKTQEFIRTYTDIFGANADIQQVARAAFGDDSPVANAISPELKSSEAVTSRRTKLRAEGK
jgi:hypothetical protein